jgi:hypothetical protein
MPTLGARFSVGGDTGTLSRADLGGELALAASFARVRVELAGSYWASVNATPAGHPDEGASLTLLTVGGRVGYVIGGGAFTFTPLVGVEVDLVTAAGFGGIAQFPQSPAWAAVDFGGTASWAFAPPFALVLTLEGVVATERPPAFVALQPGGAASLVVAQPSQLAMRPFLGLEMRFY